MPLKAKRKDYALEDPEVIEAEHWIGADTVPVRPPDDPVQEIAAPSAADCDDEHSGQEAEDELERLSNALDAAWEKGELTPEAIDASIKDFRSRHPYRP